MVSLRIKIKGLKPAQRLTSNAQKSMTFIRDMNDFYSHSERVFHQYRLMLRDYSQCQIRTDRYDLIIAFLLSNIPGQVSYMQVFIPADCKLLN